MNATNQIHDLPASERFSLAKQKAERMANFLSHHIALHENNAQLVYSPILSSQIGKSYAANAFKVVQEGIHHFEIIQLCTFWDPARLNRYSIPTVVKLVDDPEVINQVFDKVRLQAAMAKAQELINSEQLKSVKNLRDKHLAHQLEYTYAEQQGTIQPMKYGDEVDLLKETIDIIDALTIGIDGANFDFDEVRYIARNFADALWKGCTIKALR